MNHDTNVVDSTATGINMEKPEGLANEPLDFILSFRDFYGQYHHHKEQMAYTAVGLYFVIATTLIALGNDVLRGISESKLLTGSVIVMLSIVSLIFVRWQLKKRRNASDKVNACTTLATRWLLTAPAAEDLVEMADPYSEPLTMWPKAIVVEVEKIQQEREKEGSTAWVNDRRAEFSEGLTYIIMLAMASMLVYRIWSCCPQVP